MITPPLLILIDNLQYPGPFELKIIGVNDESFVDDIRKAVAGCLTKGEEHLLECSTREKGKYTSISLRVYVESSTQLYKVCICRQRDISLIGVATRLYSVQKLTRK